MRSSSSMRSRNPAALSGVGVAILAVVGSGVMSQVLSARREVESRLPSVWPAKFACTWGGRRTATLSCVELTSVSCPFSAIVDHVGARKTPRRSSRPPL